jgi:hypothetical protein
MCRMTHISIKVITQNRKKGDHWTNENRKHEQLQRYRVMVVESLKDGDRKKSRPEDKPGRNRAELECAYAPTLVGAEG